MKTTRKKYYASYNINMGGVFAPNEGFEGEWGELEGNNLREIKKELNAILRKHNARKNSPFSWWVHIDNEKECVFHKEFFTDEFNVNFKWER